MQLEEPLVFEAGADRLVGIVHRASEARDELGIVIIVGGPQYRVGSHRQFTLMARAFAAEGISVMRFDYRGMGDSEGQFGGFTAIADEIDSAICAFFRAVPGINRIVLWGLCDAASAILLHGCRDKRVGAIVLANPWIHSVEGEARAYVKHYYWRRILQASFWSKVLALRFDWSASLVDWLRKVIRAQRARRDPTFVEHMLAGLQAFDGPVLILLSEHDLVADQFADLCRQPGPWRDATTRNNVFMQHLAGVDHTFSGNAGVDAAVEACRRWLARAEVQSCR